MVDTPKEGDGDDATKDNPLDKPPKQRRRRRSKSHHSKNSDNGARNNNTPVDSKGNDAPMDPAMEQDELGDDEHSPELTSDDANLEGKIHQPVSGEGNSLDDDALIIPKKHSEQENLHRRLIAITMSLKKQKQKLKVAQDTLNRRWYKVLGTEEKYGGDRHTKSYPKCKLLPEFDDEAISAGPIAPWP